MHTVTVALSRKALKEADYQSGRTHEWEPTYAEAELEGLICQLAVEVLARLYERSYREPDCFGAPVRPVSEGAT